MELQDQIDRLAELGVVAVAVSQEDESLEEFARFQASGFEPAPRFELVADLGREHTPRYDRTSATLIDEQGIVREVFPMLLRYRASWAPILDELGRR